MDEKLSGIAYFLRDARRIDELEKLREEKVRQRISAKQYIVEKVIELSKIDFENFSTDLLAERQFITDNLNLMFVDDDKTWHCLYVVQIGSGNSGILVQSKKCEFPKYTALYQR